MKKKIQTIQKRQGWSQGWVRWKKARQMSRDAVVESNSNMLAFAVVSLNDQYHAYQKGKITGWIKLNSMWVLIGRERTRTRRQKDCWGMRREVLNQKKAKVGTGEMAQCLSALVAIPEELGSIPGTHVVAKPFSSRESEAFFWFPKTPIHTKWKISQC